MLKKIPLILLAGIGLALTGCQQQAASVDEAKIPIEVQAVTLGELPQTLFYNGDIKAEFDVKVFSKVPDRIERYYVDEGDKVEKGSPIAKVTATTMEQAVRQAEAAVAAAEAQEANLRTEYERAQRLRGEDAMSQQQYDAVKTQYEAVSAQVIQARAGLISAKSLSSDATVSAPMGGIIGKRYYEEGDMAAPSMPVASVVQMDRVKIEVEAPEADMGRLAVGQRAAVTVRSFPGEVFEGKVIKISPVLDPLTRMATVEILIPNPGHRLKPGMFAEVEVTTGVIENTIVVPRYCVIENTSMVQVNGKDQVTRNYFVYVMNDSSKAEQRQLDVTYVNHQSIAVKGGLSLGEKLVVQGQNNLRDGVAVVVPQPEEAN